MSSIIEITRLETSPAGTISTISVNKDLIGFTLSPPWNMNKKDISCIPDGHYFCKQYYSETYKRMCFAVYNVVDRTLIRIHQGNTLKDTTGCELPGMHLGSLSGKRAVLNSRYCLDNLITISSDVNKLIVRSFY